ncbi:MAG: 5'/3'-nucleotidase SurE [Bacteroidales bacterium]|nr:5'/3'-nucleotidase SurE [Bacteroidales bacterium]
MKKNYSKTILVTNDDGYQAPGINHLVESLRGLGRIIVVAPDSPRSGFSASFTCTRPVSLTCISDDGEVAIFACSGTPVDCVKLGLHRFFGDCKPDLLVSGINHGGNDSICIMYSGTMGAALEGAVVGVPSIGFSLLDFNHEADFSEAVRYTRFICESVLEKGMPHGVALNVNIPVACPLLGARVCRQAEGFWDKEFLYLEGDEHEGTALFQVTGEYVNREPEATDTDRFWLEHDYVSIVPVEVDYTHHQQLANFRYLEK